MGCGSSKSGSESAPAAYDVLIRMLIVGDSGAGKSSLLIRFTDDDFLPSALTTIGIEFKLKVVDIDGKRVKLQMWDTAGGEQFRADPAGQYRAAQAIILVYDIADRRSFLSLKTWMKDVEQHAIPSVNKLLLGNKSDLGERREVEAAEGAALAEECGYRFMETSAKTGDGVQQAFTEVAQDALRRILAEYGKQ